MFTILFIIQKQREFLVEHLCGNAGLFGKMKFILRIINNINYNILQTDFKVNYTIFMLVRFDRQ